MSIKQIANLLVLMLITVLLAVGCTSSDGLLTAQPTPTTTREATATQPPTAEPTEQEVPEEITCPPIDADLRTEMDTIEDQVVTLRGLQPSTPVERVLLTSDQLRQRVSDDFLDEYSEGEALDDTLVYALLGLLPPDFDLWNFKLDVFSEQIAGFYDDSSEEMSIICGTGFGVPERWIYTHEYVHVLQDQNFDLDDALDRSEEACEADSDRCTALLALIEGDATFLQLQWMGIYLDQDELKELLKYSTNLDTPVFDSAPHFLRQELEFPYMVGMTFVSTLSRKGGWAEVDAVYQDPPLSTEQILHPDRYPHDVPIKLVAPEVLDILGDNWRVIDHDVLGELYTQFVLNEFLPKADAEQAAEGWGGDYYLAFHNDSSGQGLLVLVTQWDTMRDVHEFNAAFSAYGDARFGESKTTSSYQTIWETSNAYTLFKRSSNQTLWILAPDSDTAEALLEAIPFPAAQQ